MYDNSQAPHQQQGKQSCKLPPSTPGHDLLLLYLLYNPPSPPKKKQKHPRQQNKLTHYSQKSLTYKILGECQKLWYKEKLVQTRNQFCSSPTTSIYPKQKTSTKKTRLELLQQKEGRKEGRKETIFPPSSSSFSTTLFPSFPKLLLQDTASKQASKQASHSKNQKQAKQSWATLLLLLSCSYCSCNTRELLQKPHRSGNTKTNKIVETQGRSTTPKMQLFFFWFWVLVLVLFFWGACELTKKHF